MKGHIDAGRRALITIRLRPEAGAPVKEIEAWIDTGFTGDLVLPHSIIEDLQLVQSGSVDSQLGNGATAVLDTYSCVIEWFAEERRIEVVSSKVRIPLLGAGLLLSHRLTVDYLESTVQID